MQQIRLFANNNACVETEQEEIHASYVFRLISPLIRSKLFPSG
jgi:hypothetical protein